MKIPIAIVEDNREIRQALEQIIELSDSYELVCSCPTGEAALAQLPLFMPKIVLMDIDLGSMSGIEVIQQLKPLYPEMLFMMCTIYDDDEKIFNALKVGANGYILKKTAPAKLLEGIADLLDGGAPMSSQIARKVVTIFQQQAIKEQEHQEQTKADQAAAADTSHLNVLSKREIEILQLLTKGFSNKEIAAAEFISTETVRKHIYNIYDKLHVNNRIEAVNYYLKR